jgi:hypothetical protein
VARSVGRTRVWLVVRCDLDAAGTIGGDCRRPAGGGRRVVSYVVSRNTAERRQRICRPTRLGFWFGWWGFGGLFGRELGRDFGGRFGGSFGGSFGGCHDRSFGR